MILLLGGARSGKSDTAARLAAGAGAPVTFIATAEPGDAEMAERIARHRAQRPTAWTTVETPLDLSSAVKAAPPADYVVVDCLTLWVSNLLGHGRTGSDVLAEARRVADLLRQRRAVVVSNEVGLGIVPANELARVFGDTLGGVNAIFAEAASRTLLMVAGRALALPSAEDALAAE
ncbi:bifunctional adenosylcobinamide kinase/adenosylcobinamide-phosphate guanylyltransferase [bacterium]|nr:MAG: bifunctional adenosylcobinamide kinase/adenosylcobinamide-phosphate guanylyltransferase [bacterium]